MCVSECREKYECELWIFSLVNIFFYIIWKDGLLFGSKMCNGYLVCVYWIGDCVVNDCGIFNIDLFGDVGVCYIYVGMCRERWEII